MNIGISRAGREGEDTGVILEAAHRCGFDGVQLKGGQYASYLTSPEGFRSTFGVRATLARGGLVAYPGGDPSTWAEKIAPIVPFAAGVGAGHICMCCSISRADASPERFRRAANALMEVGRAAVARGVTVSLHNHADSLCETEDDMARFVEVLDPSTCGLTIDTGHTARAGIDDAGRVVKRFKEHVHNVHLKDMRPDGSFCALGTGTVDLESVLESLSAIGYDRWLVVDEESKDLAIDEAFDIARSYLAERSVIA